jgi:hypothetical protein
MAWAAALMRAITKSQAVFCGWLLIWALILLCGISLYRGVVEQRVASYPNSGQLDLYVYFPVALVLANVALITCARKLPLGFRLVAFVVQFFALLFFIFAGSGGV